MLRRSLIGVVITISMIGVSVSGCRNAREDTGTTVNDTLPPYEQMSYLTNSGVYNQLNTELKDYRIETQEFLDRIKDKHTAVELKEWARNVVKGHINKRQSVFLPREEIPDFIRNLDPPDEPRVVINPNSSVAVFWGGGFGSRGLYLAESNHLSPSGRPAFYIIDWAPGVQVYHDIQ